MYQQTENSLTAVCEILTKCNLLICVPEHQFYIL